MSEQASPPLISRLYIGDQTLDAGSGGVHAHLHPVSGAVQASVPLAGAAEVDTAVACAKEAFKTWRFWHPEKRRDVLLRLAQLIEQHAADFAALAVLDNGTALMAANHGAQIAKEWVAYYAGWADKLDGQLTASYGKQGEHSYTLPQPYGVIGIIITWNGPLISLGMKVAPALAAGNTIVCKPSELTPFAADLFTRLVFEAGIPRGVFNLVTGTVAAGEALVRHPDVRKVSFTGGPTAARRIMAACAEQLKPSLLELGGKSANLIFPDADLDTALPYAVVSSIGFMSGQGCAFPTRLLVHESIYDDVVARVAAIAGQMKVGDPGAPDTIVGPLVNAAACERVMGMIERAVESRAGRLVCGGTRLAGNYITPTVFADVDPRSEIAQVEVFGPVLVVMKFATEEEAVALANDTEYGLSAYIQTNDVRRIHRLAELLDAGTVYVNGARQIRANTPFGGLGISGIGAEGPGRSARGRCGGHRRRQRWRRGGGAAVGRPHAAGAGA